MTAPQPIAQGNLSNKPLSHVLLSIHDKNLSGTLAVWPDDEATPGQDRLLFRRGKLVAALLVEPASDMARGLMPLLHRKVAPYAFYKEDLVGDAPAAQRDGVHVLALVAAAARGGARREIMEAVLARLSEPAYRFVRGGDVAALQLIQKEQAVVDLVRATPRSIQEWIQLSGDERVATRTLYLLAITRQLEPAPVATSEGQGEASSAGTPLPDFDARRSITAPPAGASVAPSGREMRFSDLPTIDTMPPPKKTTKPPAPATARSGKRAERPSVVAPPKGPPSPPPGISDAHHALWIDIQARFDAIDTENYFEMLGVDNAANDDAVQDAYVDRIKRYHPDRLPAELGALRPFVDTIFRHLTEGKKTLLDPEKRKEHFKAVQSGGGSPAADRKLAAILTAALEYQKVEVLVRRREWNEAIDILDESMELSPDEADYPAMKAWIIFQRDGDAAKDEILALTERAFGLRPEHEQALLTLAYLHKRLGDSTASVSYFERIVEANPKHVDAARELRLAKMRGQTSTPPPEEKSEGLFSKLFGSKKKG